MHPAATQGARWPHRQTHQREPIPDKEKTQTRDTYSQQSWGAEQSHQMPGREVVTKEWAPTNSAGDGGTNAVPDHPPKSLKGLVLCLGVFGYSSAITWIFLKYLHVLECMRGCGGT